MVGWATLMGLFWTQWFRAMDRRFAHLPRVTGVISKVAATGILASPVTNTLFLAGVTTLEYMTKGHQNATVPRTLDALVGCNGIEMVFITLPPRQSWKRCSESSG